MSNYKKDIETIANMFYEAIKKGTAPWMKTWEASEFKSCAHNPVTKTKYQGMNSLVLEMVRIDKEYKDNAWLTFKQIKDLGGTLEKGSKSVNIIAFKQRVRTEEEILKKENQIKDDETIPEDLKPNLIEANRKRKINKIYNSSNVFNIEQTKGIDLEKIKKLYKNENFEKKDFITIEDCQKILDSINDLKIKHFEQKRAYYNYTKDEIVLPLKTQFKDSESYYSVAFHELGHSTGHETRLNRDMSGVFGEDSYAREELRAEIYSFLQAQKLGIKYDLGNHFSYIDSWTTSLENKKEEIIEAIKDSFKIVDYVQEHYIDKATLSINKEIKEEPVMEDNEPIMEDNNDFDLK